MKASSVGRRVICRTCCECGNYPCKKGISFTRDWLNARRAGSCENSARAQDSTSAQACASPPAGPPPGLRRAGEDPALLDGSIRALGKADDENFLQIVQILDRGGHWERRVVGPGPWLRWLTLGSRDPDAELRCAVCQRVARFRFDANRVCIVVFR